MTLAEVDAGYDLIADDLQQGIKLNFGSESSDANPHVFMNEVPSESAVPNRTLATHKKNKYSASNEIRANNFNNITSRIARISNKADRHLSQLKNKLRERKKERVTIDRHVRTNTKRGLLEVNPAEEAFKDDEEERLQQITSQAIPSVKIMEIVNKEKVATKELPNYVNNKTKKIKKATLQRQKRYKNVTSTAVKKRIKTKPPTVVASVEEDTQQNKIKINAARSRRKRRPVEEQLQYKVNIRKQKAIKKKRQQSTTGDVEETQYLRDVNARLRTIENLQRNMPGRLVTKPLDGNSPFITGGAMNPSAYDASSSVRSNRSSKSGSRTNKKY